MDRERKKMKKFLLFLSVVFTSVNETPDTLLAQERFVDMILVQAKDKNGVWRNIQASIPKYISTEFWIHQPLHIHSFLKAPLPRMILSFAS
jgi:hypothetical protein